MNSLYASLLIYSTVTPCLLACVRHSRSGERLHVDTRNPSVDEIGERYRLKHAIVYFFDFSPYEYSCLLI